MNVKKIVVLATGGTLAGTAASAQDNVGYTAATLGIEQLLASNPGLEGLPLVSEQVAQIDSKDMGFEVWRKLAGRCAHWIEQADVAGIVITHGTDTLEETAYFLQAVLPAAKPVVLTCAMRPATALMPDGPQNVVDAVTVAMTPGARGVVAVCAGTIHSSADVAKQHTYRLDAFTSGDAGPVGYVEEGKVRLVREWPAPSASARATFGKFNTAGGWPRVEIIMNYAGATAAIVEALQQQGVAGLVVAGTGNGTIHHDLEGALLRAQAAGVKVVRATRCAQGHVIAGAPTTLPASGLSPVKARIELMLSLLG